MSVAPQAGVPVTTPQQPASLTQDPAHAEIPTGPVDGSALFAEKGCAYCHGANAVGSEKAPSLQDIGKRMKPVAVEHQIKVGGGGMPAFGDVLVQPEIDELVKYLLALKKPQAKPHAGKPAAFPASTQARSASGVRL